MILNSSQKEFADANRARLEAELSGPDLSERDQKILDYLELWECSRAYNLNDTVKTIQGYATTANLPYNSIMNIGKTPPSAPGNYPWWTVWESPSQIFNWKEIDLADVPNVSVHIPGHRRMKLAFVIAGLAIAGLLWFAWRVG